MSKSAPRFKIYAQEQKKINPIDDAISIFLKQQKEYDEYLKKLREEVEKGSPREKLKGGGQSYFNRIVDGSTDVYTKS